MSELKVDCNCHEEQESKDEFFVTAMDVQEKSLKLEVESTAELEQVQRRQSIVYENAQQKVTALETLLNTVAPNWSKQPAKAVTATAGTTAQHCPPPQAYRFKDIYEHKKQQLLRQHLEQERNQRQFHSRPMPNFRHVHQQQANKPIVHRITRPVTPNVLKSSREMLLKRSQKIEQVIQQREQQQQKELQLRPKTKPMPKFNVIPLKVNNCQLITQTAALLAPKPFQFSTELRAEQRKRFNAQSQQVQENRRREQEEQRRKLEHQEYQRHRQLATFRARPNPFRPHI